MLPQIKVPESLGPKPELSTMERIAIPGLLLGGLYSAYSTAITGIHYINDIRNTIFQIGVYPVPDHKLPAEYARMLFEDDWIPLWIGNCVYSGLIGLIILLVPLFLIKHRHMDANMKRHIFVMAVVSFLLPFAGFICNLYGGLLDIQHIKVFIAALPAGTAVSH